MRSATPKRNYICGRRRSYGAIILFETSASGRAVDVLAFMDGRAQAIHRIYLNDDQVTLSGGYVQQLADERYKDNVIQVGFSLGEATETAFSAVVAALPGVWTSSHRGDGVVCGYMIKAPVKSKNYLTTYPQGDNIALSPVIDSWHLYDPRLSGQDWDDDDTWSGPYDNPVLGLLRYLVIVRGEDYTARIEPVINYWKTAANICDSSRALKAGGSEKLYRCAMMWDSSAKPSEVIGEFLKSFDGWMGEDGDGHIILYAGQLYTPTVTVDADSILDYEVKNFVEDEDRVNEVVVSYVSDQHDFNTVEASAWQDAADIAARGRVVSTTFEPQVPSHAQAQYLARRLAAKANAQYTGTVTTNYSGRSIIGHRYINLEIIEAGATFFSGVAEVQSIERNQQTGGVVFSWASVSSALDDWNPVTDEGDPAPVGAGVSLTPLDVPEITATSATLEGSSARILVTATGPNRADLTWFLHWRLTGETIWNEQEYGDIGAGASVDLVSDLVPLDSSIEVEVSYATGDGRFSGWSDTETVSTDTAGLAPSPNTSFSASGGSGSVAGSWSNSTSANFGHSELFGGATSDFEDASQIGSDFSGSAGAVEVFSESVSAGTWYLWSVAYNAADSEASVTGPIQVTVT